MTEMKPSEPGSEGIDHLVDANKTMGSEGAREEVKLCPFCGNKPKVLRDGFVFCESNCGCSDNFKSAEWNNAWAHERIAEIQELSDLRLRDLQKYMKQAYDLERQLKEANENMSAMATELNLQNKEVVELEQQLSQEKQRTQAYREAAINNLCEVFKDSDTNSLKGLPSSVKIPRREFVHKYIDAEATQILRDKAQGE